MFPAPPTDPANRGSLWALIIGIDYKGHDRKDLQLENAEKDATLVRDTLTSYYQLDPDRTALLLGKDATKQAIEDHLAHKFLHSERIKEEDSVLVFFAGHGDRRPGERKGRQEGILFPWDIVLASDRATSRQLRLEQDVLQVLRNCRARHKLLILDCCHSGEVFSRALPRSEVDERRDPQLFTQPSFQAIASCRNVQLASDGSGENSPFTKALSHALVTLPLQRAGSAKHFPVTDVFHAMQHRFLVLGLNNNQRPDLRSLIENDGEFFFFPGPLEKFPPLSSSDADLHLIQATVPGEHGNWWFDDIPWFLPSVRRHILQQAKPPPTRSLAARAMRKVELLALAKEAAKKIPESDELLKVRKAHFEKILAAYTTRGGRFKECLGEVAQELKTKRETLKLEAADLHLLAVLQHSLRDKDSQNTLAADETYRAALKAYDSPRSGPGDRERDLPLKALCHADYACYLTDVEYRFAEAAEHFRLSREVILTGAGTKQNAPNPFLIYALCNEADAWQQLDHWGDANARFKEAVAIASLADVDSLKSYVYRRYAWAYIEQWKVAKADKAFEQASKVLEGNKSSRILEANGDVEVKILQAHNRHGRAMAVRFQGRSQEAARMYRAIIRDIAQEMQDLREREAGKLASTSNHQEIQTQLLIRWINSLERLGDCNLFAPPDERDLKEAIDDYRRAHRLCFGLPETEDPKVSLLRLDFKLALVHALRSPVQDTELARKHCETALVLLDDLTPNQKAQFITYQNLVPPIVEVLAANQGSRAEPDRRRQPLRSAAGRSGGGSGSKAEPDRRRQALEKLRHPLVALRSSGKHNIHRDILELTLFAGKILVEERIETDHYETLRDIDLLRHFCHKVYVAEHGGAAAYLRQHYDAAVRAVIALEPKHVKDLLALQREALEGRQYLKESDPSVILALYPLDGRCHFFLDVPNGVSKCFCVDAARADLVKAMGPADQRLKLPPELLRELERLRLERLRLDSKVVTGEKVKVELWWQDRSDKPHPVFHVSASIDPKKPAPPPPPSKNFPFVLPDFIESHTPETCEEVSDIKQVD